VRILCTVYDPRSGAYRLNYALFIEIFSGITIIGAIGYIFIGEWRRNRKAHDS
jgi:protein SCO1/2